MTRKTLACSIIAAALSMSAAHATKTTLNGGGSSLAYPVYVSEFKQYTSKNTSILFSYEAVGSGSGQAAFLNNDITYFEPVSGTNTHGYPAGTLTYGTIVGTQVDFGASDAVLAASQFTNPATGSYGTATEGSAVDGPLIQIPSFGTPVTLAFNESGISGNALTLTDNQICGVLSGQITDWNTLNSSIPAGTTINVAYRSDGSGTSFLLSNHLAAVCTASNSNFPLPITASTHFATLFGSNPIPANFTGESGSGNLSAYEVATANSFGYLSPDYTSIAPNSPNKTTLQVASVVNGVNHTAYLPNVANTELGLKHPGAGSTNATPPATLANAMNPLNWVPVIPQTTQGYSIVGYTTLDFSSCYASKTAGTALNALLTNQFTNTKYEAFINNDGFAQLAQTGASPYVTKIQNVFLGNKSAYNLNIDNTTTCASYAGR